MINTTFLWFLLVPVILGAVVWYVGRDKFESLKVVGCYAAIMLVLTSLAVFGTRASATLDTEIHNGRITGKSRIHDTYEESYECMCSTSKVNGQDIRTCQTCYTTHYTVEWIAESTLGPFLVDKVDDTNKKDAYEAPNPKRWLNVIVGEPAAKTSFYTNYVQAVPNSLFTPSSSQLTQQFAALVPPYPDSVFDLYRINRVLTPGFSLPDTARWNHELGMVLRDLGPKKQVNAILVIAKTADPNYEYALRDAWEGANKNDVVVVIGSTEYPKIEWVRIISWTKSEIFKIKLKDRIEDLGTINDQVIPSIADEISKSFERRRMREFKYLEAEIDPPTWAIVLLLLANLACAGYAIVLVRN